MVCAEDLSVPTVFVFYVQKHRQALRKHALIGRTFTATIVKNHITSLAEGNGAVCLQAKSLFQTITIPNSGILFDVEAMVAVGIGYGLPLFGQGDKGVAIHILLTLGHGRCQLWVAVDFHHFGQASMADGTHAKQQQQSVFFHVQSFIIINYGPAWLPLAAAEWGGL